MVRLCAIQTPPHNTAPLRAWTTTGPDRNATRDKSRRIRHFGEIAAALLLATGFSANSGRAEDSEADQRKQREQQLVQQMQPILISELALLRSACDLTPEQRPLIKAAGQATLDATAKKFVAMTVANRVMINGQLQPVVRVAVNVNLTQENPQATLHQALEAAVEQTLTADQFRRYREEGAARDAARKQVAILVAVAAMSEALFLTPAQADQISQAIAGQWQGNWEAWLMLPQYGGQRYPTIPDNLVKPYISDDQWLVWSSLRKINLASRGFNRPPLFLNTSVNLDDPWWNAPAAVKDQGSP